MRPTFLRALSLTFLTVTATAAQSTDWKNSLEQALETSEYSLAKVAALDGNRITQEGTTLVVKRHGILASPARRIGAVNTKVRNGQIVQPGGVSALFSDRGTRQFEVGDVVYLTEIEVRNRVIVLDILSREIRPTLEKGSTVQMRYKGQLEFHFDADFLKRASGADVRRELDQFLDEVSSNAR